MEDVIDSALRMLRSALIHLLVLGVITNPLYAARQGSVGQASSLGSISISLTIPDSAQLIVKSSRDTNSLQDEQFCLHVLDSFTGPSSGFYNVAGLNGDLYARYGIGETNYQTVSSRIKLDNNYLKTTNDNRACDLKNTIEIDHTSNKSALLLILIAE